MNQKPLQGVLKHADFIVLDVIMLQVSFVIAFWVIVGPQNPYAIEYYQFHAEILILSQLIVIAFTQSYKNILKKGYIEDFFSIFSYTVEILIVAVVILFLTHQTINVSRMLMGTTLVLFVILGFIVRTINKLRLINNFKKNNKRLGSSLVLITTGDLVDVAMEKLTESIAFMKHFVSGIILLDGNESEIHGDYNIPIVPLDDEAIKRLRKEWVDEVLILQPSDTIIDRELLNTITDMGITVHFTLALLNDDKWPPLEMRKLGSYKVLTSGMKTISVGQAIAKRAMDIAGGIVGCIITGILFIFIAPAIYIKSPGPIFFKQDRVGKNGKVFKMYKFRSMYLDAEERKAALMEQNKVEGGLMFKMDDDPRIIGSEEKGKDGKPKGIGNFIRNTSIDEFPQFFNVLKGEMSLVGTRPPTLSEFELYDIHHRARMTTKPGITGMWQVSGRSEITDFEEVVRLDREYIENWSLALDLKILLKTIYVVFARKGAE